MAARKQYPLRIDPALWQAVELWAQDDMRSANAQVEWIIRDALRRADRLPRARSSKADTPPEMKAPELNPPEMKAPEMDQPQEDSH